MNIAILCYHRVGGSGIVAHELGVSLAETGRHNIHFVGLEPPFRHLEEYKENLCFHKVEIEEYPVFVYPPYTLSLASQLADIIDQYDIDVIHSHYAIPHAIAAILAKNIAKRKVRTVTTLHGTDITLIGTHPTFKNITRHAIEASDEVTAVSEYLKKKTLENLHIPDHKIKRIYNFVNRQRFNPDLKCCDCFTRVPGKKIVAHASNLRHVKAPLDVVRIFDGIAKSISYDCELWIIGDGPMRPEMVEMSRILGIENKVRFLGIQLDLGALLVCCDLFLLPSREESFGLAGLEAMACGVPVVASAVGGLREVIEDNISGRLVLPGDVEAGINAGKRILQDRQFAALVRKNGLETAFEKFNQERIVSQYEDVYGASGVGE